jgi:hypothetical protein
MVQLLIDLMDLVPMLNLAGAFELSLPPLYSIGYVKECFEFIITELGCFDGGRLPLFNSSNFIADRISSTERPSQP